MFWIKLGGAFLIMFAIMVICNVILKKIFNIETEKKKLFSSGHVNELHKKVDWFLRISTGIATIIVGYFLFFESLSLTLFLVIMLGLLILDYSVRAVFQWKYSETPKQSILMINEMVWLVIGVVVIFQFDVLNLY